MGERDGGAQPTPNGARQAFRVKVMLSRPLLVSFDGSPFKKVMVVVLELAVK